MKRINETQPVEILMAHFEGGQECPPHMGGTV